MRDFYFCQVGTFQTHCDEMQFWVHLQFCIITAEICCVVSGVSGLSISAVYCGLELPFSH